MEIFTLIVVIGIIRAIVSAIREQTPVITTLTSAREPLCNTCAYAHIARGYRDRQKLIACTFGGTVRPLKFVVSDCTLYCNRNPGIRLVRVTGFAETQLDESLSPTVAAISPRLNADG